MPLLNWKNYAYLQVIEPSRLHRVDVLQAAAVANPDLAGGLGRNGECQADQQSCNGGEIFPESFHR